MARSAVARRVAPVEAVNLTAREYSAVTGVSLRTVRRWIAAERISVVRVSPRRLGIVVPLAALLERRRRLKGAVSLERADPVQFLVAQWGRPPRIGGWFSIGALARACGCRPRVLYRAVTTGELQGFRRPHSNKLGVHWAQAIWYADDAAATAAIVRAVVETFFHDETRESKAQIRAGVIARVTPLLGDAMPRW